MTMTTDLPMNREQRRKSVRARSRKVAAVALVGLVLASGFSISDLAGPIASAQAATAYVGLYDGTGDGVGSVLHTDGTQMYCLEIMRNNDPGRVDAPLTSAGTLPAITGGSTINGMTFPNTSVPAANSETVRQINYVLTKWGQTQDNQQAAAVQLAVWQIRGGSGDFNALYAAFANMADSRSAGTSALATQFANEARTTQAAPTVPVSPIVQSSSPYAGTLNVSAGTTVVTVVNGIFLGQPGVTVSADGRTATVTDGAAHNIQWRGQPDADDEFGRYYTVTFDGSYQTLVAGSIIRYADQGSGAMDQDLGSGDGTYLAGDFDAIYWDPDTIWSPVLTTETPSKFIPEGQPFSDTVTFDVADGSNPWRFNTRADGSTIYAPVVAQGTLYGPFLSDPALNPSGTPPVGAPVAATATVTTDMSQGPGTYTIDTGAQVSQEAGYYTWVWDIDFADQASEVVTPANGMESSLPENYFFTDGFGQASEGQLTPSNIEISTELSAHSVVLGESFTDDVTANLVRGGWLQDETGGRTPFTLRGTAYLTDTAPTQQATAPSDAVVLGTTSISADTPGMAVTSDPITIPIGTQAQYVTMQWCLFDEDQTVSAAGKAVETCDDWGVPSETAEIVRPGVTTQAQPLGAVKGDIMDTANILGGLPSDVDLEVAFTAYLKPEAGQPKYDENWQPVLDGNGDPVLWTEDEVADPDAVCAVQPVAQTDAVPVTGPGTVDSPTVRAETEGTIYWVETLRTVTEDPNEESVVLHRGICGLPNETTTVEPPRVSTMATQEAVVGEEIFDTAIVEGPLSERTGVSYQVTFEAYHRAEGETTEPDESLCTADTKVWESNEPTLVSATGSYESERWVTDSEHVGEILWVETLWMLEEDEDSSILTEVHRGECGAEDEITKVKEPVSPAAKAVATASENAGTIGGIAGGIAALAAAAGSILFFRNRRKTAAATTGAESDTE